MKYVKRFICNSWWRWQWDQQKITLQIKKSIFLSNIRNLIQILEEVKATRNDSTYSHYLLTTSLSFSFIKNSMAPILLNPPNQLSFESNVAHTKSAWKMYTKKTKYSITKTTLKPQYRKAKPQYSSTGRIWGGPAMGGPEVEIVLDLRLAGGGDRRVWDWWEMGFFDERERERLYILVF